MIYVDLRSVQDSGSAKWSCSEVVVFCASAVRIILHLLELQTDMRIVYQHVEWSI